MTRQGEAGSRGMHTSRLREAARSNRGGHPRGCLSAAIDLREYDSRDGFLFPAPRHHVGSRKEAVISSAPKARRRVQTGPSDKPRVASLVIR